MDNLVLIRVAPALDANLRRAVLGEVRSEGPHRFRLLFERDGRAATVVVSLRPELPWIGRPAVRAGYGPGGDPFAASCSRALAGAVLSRIHKPSIDRVVRVELADGRALVAELATHGANLVLLDAAGVVLGSARRPRRAMPRIEPGRPYAAPSLPRRLLDPFGADAARIDRHLAARVGQGEPELEALRRHVFGVGTDGAVLVLEEALAKGLSAGEVLARRLAALAAGELDPAIAAPDDPLRLVREGAPEAGQARLLPWSRGGPGELTRRDAASTAGWFHEAVELQVALAGRAAGLTAVLQAELRRVFEAELRVESDLRSFEDPERYRRWGEALLAGLAQARFEGDRAVVADPYDPDRQLRIPVTPGRPLPGEADRLFARHRRARRGQQAARRRLEELRERRGRLERLAARHERAAGERDVAALEGALREEGIPVGLGSRRRASAGRDDVRVEGVRMFRSSDDEWILIGRSGRDNDRLTFKIATPDDFWLHAAGRPGAHVVVRNPSRRNRPSRATLEEAAALAAWYSQARHENRVDVQWTRRRNVRRVRGAPAGTVTVKRYETLRVRPAVPGARRGRS